MVDFVYAYWPVWSIVYGDNGAQTLRIKFLSQGQKIILKNIFCKLIMKMLRIVNDISFYGFLGPGNTMEYLFL